MGGGLASGISAAIGGSGFGAGFSAAFSGAGSLTGAGLTGATSSFISGAAIGAGSGFGSGFISAFGNGLMDGNSFNNSINNGFKSGLIGGVSGGLLGGIASGIDAVKNGRRFFDGARIEDETISLNLKRVPGSVQSTCGPSSLESVDHSFGGNLMKDDIASWYGGNTEYGIGDLTLMNDYASKTNRLLDIRNGAVSQENMFRALKDNTRITLSMRHSSGMDHMVAVNSVSKRTIHKVSGKIINKWMTTVMDPYYGSYQKLNMNSIYKTFYIFNR